VSAPFFDLLRTRVTNAISEAKAAASAIDHPGLAGEFREIAARQLVEPFLTQSFRCGTGKIVDTTGHVTRQIDLVIYSTRYAPAFMLYNDKSLFPAECCKYAFEVKSTLTASTIREALEVGGSVQKLKRFPTITSTGEVTYAYEGLVTVLLAFSSDIQGDELERFLQYETSPNPRFTAILVLDKGYWVHFSNGRGWSGATLNEVPDAASFYAMFIAGMTNTLVGEELSWRSFLPGHYMMPPHFGQRDYGPSRPGVPLETPEAPPKG